MIRTWTTVAYRDIETGTTIDGSELNSLVESELSQGSFGTHNACTTLYHEWLDSHHTASQIVTIGENRVRQEFIRELFENKEMLGRLGYEPITVPGEGTESLTIGGLCPWTAAYMWDPESTLYGHGLIPGETVLDDGRTLASVPLLCRLWGMSAEGWELEEGCCVGGRYSCGPDGALEYEDDWREYVEEMAALNPDDDYWNVLLEECEVE